MRPLATLDLETTGTDIALDAIVSIGLFIPESTNAEIRVRPWKRIPAEVEALIGITNDDVEHSPPFKDIAMDIHGAIAGCDIAGFGVRDFDVPLLWEEFYRCGITWDISDTLIIDAGVIFKLKESRTLTAAMQFYCGKDHSGAHRALDDAIATAEVLDAQLKRYPDLAALDREGLSKASEYDGPKRISMDGKIRSNEHGEAIYGFGKHEGQRVRDHQDYAQWMLGKDFPEHTKMVLKTLLSTYAQRSSKPTQKALL